MYRVTEENDYSADIKLIISHINKHDYSIRGRDNITKSAKSTRNIFKSIMQDVMVDFVNGPRAVEEEFYRLYDESKIEEIMNESDVCKITEPEPCMFADDLILQFNKVRRIMVDPCTYEYSRIPIGGGKINMTSEEYKAELEAYVNDYNRRCALFYITQDNKKVYPYKQYSFGSFNQLMPKLKTINFSYERAALRVISNKLKFTGCSLDESIDLVKEYVNAMRVPSKVDKFARLNLKNDYQTIVSYILLHWMWLVKRNLHDDPSTVEEIFVNIFGAQSSGKTTFVEDLSHPLQYFFAEADVKKVMDEREIKLFVNKRIIFFDEFGSKAKLTGDETTAMKKIITSDTIHQRQMHTTEFSVMRRKFTGISATNIPIGEIVKDSSGARRYFEIITDTVYDKDAAVHFDFEYLDGKKVEEDNGKFAYVDIWKVVDDTIETGYISLDDSVREDIRKIQSTYVPESSTIQYMKSENCTYVDRHCFTEEELLSKHSQDDYMLKGITDLYKGYVDWCKSNNQDQAKTLSNFKKDIEELPILTKSRNRGMNSDGTPRVQNFYYVFVGVDNITD